MNALRHILLTLLLAMILLPVYAQSVDNEDKLEGEKATPGIKVIARAYNDSIVLRWGATSPLAWQSCNTYGVRIERYTLYRNGKSLKETEREKTIIADNITPLPEEQWERFALSDDRALIAAQAIYGSSFEVESNASADMMTMINMSQELENRHGFALLAADQSPEVASAAGLRWKDLEIKSNEKYLYRIYSLVPDSILAIDTGYVFVDASERFEIPRPRQLSAEFDDRMVKLSWNRKIFESIFSGYIVERSDDEGKTFKPLDQTIYINTPPANVNPERMYRIDSLPANNKKFIYRVKGITPFGEVSPPSENVEGMGVEKVRYANPNILDVKNIENKAMKITWDFSSEYEGKIKGFVISRAKSTDSVFRDVTKKMLPPQSREYMDNKPAKINYYKVRAVDMSGSELASFPAFGQLIDSIPPAAPIGLKGQIDSLGIVTVHWKPGKEDDLFGYRIYRANSLKEEFTQVTKATVRDTIYRDTIEVNTLTKKVYYKLMALDENYNASKFSGVLELKRPDRSPPVPPRFSEVVSADTGIYLRWNHSPSNDVVKELLYRKEEGQDAWVLIAVSDSVKTFNHFVDKQLRKGVEYYYILIAVDDSKLESEPGTPVSARLIDTYIKPEIAKINKIIDREKLEIKLTWDYKEQGVERYQVYRSEGESPFRLYKNVSELYFTDKNLTINTSYKYRIRAFFSDGSHSQMSKELMIEF
ncbi:MAG: hypothetical protein ACK4ND_07700 [Cytophagaceae bacterium]